MPQPRSVSTSYLFELIGRQHVELGLVRLENEQLLRQLETKDQEPDPVDLTSKET